MPRAASRRRRDQLVARLETLHTSIPNAGEPMAKAPFNPSQSAPEIGPSRTIQGVRLVPLADLVAMKLTSFRSKDETHLKDLDEAGLITPEIESGLSETLRARLAQVRARE